MGRRPILTDPEIDREILSRVGPRIVVRHDREGFPYETPVSEMTERERWIFLAGVEYAERKEA